MNQIALVNGEIISVNRTNEVFEACLIEGNKLRRLEQQTILKNASPPRPRSLI